MLSTDSVSDRSLMSEESSDESGKGEPVQHLVIVQRSTHVLARLDFHEACYGRIEVLERLSRSQVQMIQQQPKLFISQRPNKRVPFEPPLSFLMGPKLLKLAKYCQSFNDLTEHLLGFSTKYDFESDTWVLLKLLNANEIDIRSSTLKDICGLLEQIHSEAAKRMHIILPHFQPLIGEDKFHLRKEFFALHWESWRATRDCMWHGRHANFPWCGCQFPSFDDFVQEFDKVFDHSQPDSAMVCARRILYLQFNCNEYFGMDGFTYSSKGERTGEEFIAINRPLPCRVLHTDLL